MKASWMAAMAMAVGFTAYAQDCAVTVFVRSEGLMQAGILLGAEAKTAAMFREIGVEVRWRYGWVRSRVTDDPCGAPILAELDATTPAGVSPGALGDAKPYAESGAGIRVFLDRVAEAGGKQNTIAVLAHVLAHEITHVLEQVNRHSEGGLMKAHWDAREQERLALHPLPFAPEDVKLIRLGIAKRVRSAASE